MVDLAEKPLRKPFVMAFTIISCVIASCSSILLDSNGTSPFIAYEIIPRGQSYDTLHVIARLRALHRGDFCIEPLSNEPGKCLAPLNLAASSVDGSSRITAEEHRWRIRCKGTDIDLEYDVVLGNDRDFRQDVRSVITFVSEDRMRIAARDLFLVPDIPIAEGIIVDVSASCFPRVVATWPSVGRRIVIPSLDEVPNTVIAAGAYRIHLAQAYETKLAVAISGEWAFEDTELLGMATRIIAAEIRAMGPTPLERYLLICDANPVESLFRFDHYGIHYAGALLVLLSPGIRKTELLDASAAVIAHEFFHNWNECVFEDSQGKFAWFTEGATVYCSCEILNRCGLMDRESLESRHKMALDRYLRNPYRSRLAIADAANCDMSDKDMVNMLYDGGYLAARALDARLQESTAGSTCLMDVVRMLSMRVHVGHTSGEEALVEVIKELGAGDFSSFIRDLAHVPDSRVLISSASRLE